MKRTIGIAFFCALLTLTSVQAQGLQNLLPNNSMAVYGAVDMASASDKLDDFVVEAQRLGVLESLFSYMQLEDVEITSSDPQTYLDNLMGFIGQEAYITVLDSVRYMDGIPIPDILAVSRLSQGALEALSPNYPGNATALSDNVYAVDLYDQDLPFPAMYMTLSGNVFILSSHEEQLRTMAASLENPPTSGSRLIEMFSELSTAQLYSAVDYTKLSGYLASLGQGYGVDALVNRLEASLASAGLYVSVGRFLDTGFESESIQLLNPDSGDKQAYDLLRYSRPVDLSDLAYVPSDALSFATSSSDIAANWAYINDLVAMVPMLGDDLESIVSAFTGVDVNKDLIRWMGKRISTITTDVADTGVASASDNFLGDSVYIIEARDEGAARRGLQSSLNSLSQMAAMFADPFGEGGSAAVEELSVSGSKVIQYNIIPGLSISFAVQDGRAFIATSQSAMEKVLSTGGSEFSTDFLERLPESMSGFSYSNDQLSLQASASTFGDSLQMMGGLSGAANIDFDALDDIILSVETYVTFLAERSGKSYGYSTKDDNRIYGYSFSEVAW